MDAQELARRTANWLRNGEMIPKAIASGAGLVAYCQASDPAGPAVIAALKADGKTVEVIGAMIFARVGPGSKVYVEPIPVSTLDWSTATDAQKIAAIERAGVTVTNKPKAVETDPPKEAMP